MSYDREAALPPKERRIYLSNLQEKYEDFKAKKQALTHEEFEAWFAKTLQDHDEARKQAGSLSEYLWLKTTRKLKLRWLSSPQVPLLADMRFMCDLCFRHCICLSYEICHLCQKRKGSERSVSLASLWAKSFLGAERIRRHFPSTIDSSLQGH